MITRALGRRRVLVSAAAALCVACRSDPPRFAAESRDLTEWLNARVRATPDGGTISLPRGRVLRVDGTVLLLDRRGLTIDGNGATLRSTRTSPLTTKPVVPMINVVGGQDITIRDIALQATNPAPEFEVRREWQPLIDVHGTQGVEISEVVGTGAWGDFLHLAPDARGETDVMAKDVRVSRCRTSLIGRNQVSLTGCEDVLVEDCELADTGYQVFDIEVQASWWTVRNVTIARNVIAGKVSLSVLVSSAGGGGVRNVQFVDNRMHEPPSSCQPPIHIGYEPRRKRGFVVRGNELQTLSNAVRAEGVDGLQFTGNRVTQAPGGGCRTRSASFVRNSDNVVVGSNTFVGDYDNIVPDPLVGVSNVVVSDNCLQTTDGTIIDGTCDPSPET